MHARLMLYLHTLRHLKSSQVFHRLKRRFFPKSASQVELQQKRPEISAHSPLFYKPDAFYKDRTFKFLNLSRTFATQIDWEARGMEKLWSYNLHYFDYLIGQALIKNETLSNDLLENWVDHNPPGLGTGWEPYPTSLRLVNVIKSLLSGNQFSDKVLTSMCTSAEWLHDNLEKDILGNHYFENGKALLFAGTYFQGPLADKWFSTGMQILESELAEQVLADGAHFELSPMYHTIIMSIATWLH